jgi:cobalt-zinc-cadmium resistance protein CzcA
MSAFIDLALKQRLLVFLGALALAVWGANAYQKLSIDAFPDVAPIQVLLSMRAPGLTPEELESRVTSPIELAMKGIPNLVKMRSTTRYSVALLTFEFADGADIFWARAQVNERLQGVRDQLPAGADGGLAPIVTPLAEMVMFTIDSNTLSPQEKRFLVDWTIRPAVRGVPGVADVNVLGGFVRTFEVVPSAPAMAARGISTEMLEAVLRANNRNDGAGRVRSGEEALLVRSEGRIRTLEDVRETVVAVRGSSVVTVGDVADVRFGSLARNGVVTSNGEEETVWGMVLGLRGANAQSVVEGVKQKFEELKPLLPEDARIRIFYDRSDLIGKAVWTVQKVLLEAIVLVVILLLLFLGNLRSALVVSLIVPLAVLATFGIMRLFGWSANIMSLGGLAIAIGLLVDCAVVVVENVEHRLAHAHKPDIATRLRLTAEATGEVATPLISGVVIIIMVFTPLLSLQGLEGRLFSPVALTIAFALAAALLLSLTIVPAMAAYILRAGVDKEPWFVRKLHALYDPALAYVMRRPLIVFVLLALGMGAVAAVYPRIGATFMPVMDEGTPVVTIRKHATISVDEAAQTDMRIERELMSEIPEIRGIMARAGADELGIDPVGLNETDMFLTLAPKSEWRNPDKQWLTGELRRVLEGIPGIAYAFTQPIDMRVQEMIIGARGDVVVKVFGEDIPTLNRLARDIAARIREVPGSVDVFALRNAGMRYLTVKVDRGKAGRLGLNAEQVQEALRVWVDGRDLGIVLEGQVRTPLIIRDEDGQRASAADSARVPVVIPNRGTVELSQVAEIVVEDGPIQVIREDGQRFATVLSNVRGRDLVGFVDEAKAANRRERSVSLRDLAGRGNPASLAIVVIGGLVTSTTLTLIHRERHGRKRIRRNSSGAGGFRKTERGRTVLTAVKQRQDRYGSVRLIRGRVRCEPVASAPEPHLEGARSRMLHVFELGRDDHAVMVPAIARPDADQFVRFRIDEGDAAGQPLEPAEHADHVFAVIGDRERLHVRPDALNLLLDLPGLGIDHHDAAARRRRMQDREIKLGAIHREHHVERVRILAAPHRCRDTRARLAIARSEIACV